jgi:uncharacterized repeat protein (TIGR03803 family)
MVNEIEKRRWICGGRRACNGVVATGTALLLSAGTLLAQDAATYTYSVLYNFVGGTQGFAPQGALVRDQHGNLYGTTADGGDLLSSSPSCLDASEYGCGLVFKLAPSGEETVLYAFTGEADGSLGYGQTTLIRDEAGNLYGTAGLGGDLSDCGGIGCGVVFKLDPQGNETVLHTFTGGADGNLDYTTPTLLRDKRGDLYGTTILGGSSNCGVVFKLDPAGKESVLHNFTNGADGGQPIVGVVEDGEGNLYGTTSVGGSPGGGVLFKMDQLGHETVLSNFNSIPNGGGGPWAVVLDDAGNLYGTTIAGGEFNDGVVYKLEPGGTYTVLHQFSGSDGSVPQTSLVLDAEGNLYGTTLFGGDVTSPNCTPTGCGVVFKLDPAGNETVLYKFHGNADGDYPIAGVILDEKGNLYGTATNGGSDLSACGGFGCGVVFKLTRSSAGNQ